MWEYGMDRAGSGQGKVAGTCEGKNEISGSIKSGKFVEQLRKDKLLKKYYAAWSELVNLFVCQSASHSLHGG